MATHQRPVSSLERIVYGYADLCLSAYAFEGWSTLQTLQSYNRDGFRYPLPDPQPGTTLEVSGVYLDDADLAIVAARIDELIVAGEW